MSFFYVYYYDDKFYVFFKKLILLFLSHEFNRLYFNVENVCDEFQLKLIDGRLLFKRVLK